MSGEGESKLVWPPKKDDLERLYLTERLSAARIARAYGLKYASQKTAESTVLYQLKRNGIARRDKAAHVRKVTEAMVARWIQRYENGESLSQIAGDEVSPVSVLIHLRKRGVRLRDKVEAQIKAVTKHVKREFSGTIADKAYLVGLARGDFHVESHGRSVRVRVSTTHPAMAELFTILFSEYGPIYSYPKEANFTGHEWNFDADLDSSFGFLFDLGGAWQNEENVCKVDFLNFLSGFFDAEGSIYLHWKGNGYAPELEITNKDAALFRFLIERLATVDVHPKMELARQSPGRGAGMPEGTIWKLRVWRFDEVQKLLKLMKLRHPERVNKCKLVLGLVTPASAPPNREIWERWEEMLETLKAERNSFIEAAKIELLRRRSARDQTQILSNSSGITQGKTN